MNMGVVKQPKVDEVMSPKQKSIIKKCLQYCIHRLQNHGAMGLDKAGVSDRDIVYALKRL